MTTRARNSIVLLAAAALLAAALIVASHVRPHRATITSAIDAIPADALAIATLRVDALRASPLARLLASEPDRAASLGPGLPTGCSFDPVERVRQLAIWVPDSQAESFGLAAMGQFPMAEVLQCARSSIGARGAVALESSADSFTLISDPTLGAGAANVAVRDGGPVLLGPPSSVARMIATAAGRVPSAAAAGDHAQMRSDLQAQAADVVLTARVSAGMRVRIREAAGGEITPLGSVLAVAAAMDLGPQARLRAIVYCEQAAACADLAQVIGQRRDEVRGSVAMRLAGVASLLDSVRVQARGERLALGAEAPVDEIVTVIERVWRWTDALGPDARPAPAPLQIPSVILPSPNEVLRPRPPDAGR